MGWVNLGVAAIGVVGGMMQDDAPSSGGGSAAAAADPFAQHRGAYAERLNNLMENPNEVLPNTPGYQAGLDAIVRSNAANGLMESGNMAVAMMKYGGDAFKNQVDMFANLAGAYQGNPAMAGQLQQQGEVNGQNMNGQMLNNLSGHAYNAYQSWNKNGAGDAFYSSVGGGNTSGYGYGDLGSGFYSGGSDSSYTPSFDGAADYGFGGTASFGGS